MRTETAFDYKCLLVIVKMFKPVYMLAVLLIALVAESFCQRPYVILPTYRPPPQKPIIIRTARQAGDEELLWLYKGDKIERAPSTGDHPYLPSYIDDIKLDPHTRTARSFDSRSSKHSGGSHSTSSSSRNTGTSHPGYNRRNARSLNYPLPPLFTPIKPRFPPRQPFPIYVSRSRRDIHLPGLKKPTYHDVVIPNWNPYIKTDPRQTLGIKSRDTRSVETLDN